MIDSFRRLAVTLASVVALLQVACDAAPEETRAPAEPAAGGIPFELEGADDAAIVVPVTVNGRGPFDFVLDTGATLTCVDAEVGDSLELPAAVGVGAVTAGVAGPSRLGLKHVDSLTVGTARARDITVCTLELGHLQQLGLDADGLLGLNFLKEFHVELDFERQVLVLAEPG